MGKTKKKAKKENLELENKFYNNNKVKDLEMEEMEKMNKENEEKIFQIVKDYGEFVDSLLDGNGVKSNNLDIVEETVSLENTELENKEVEQNIALDEVSEEIKETIEEKEEQMELTNEQVNKIAEELNRREEMQKEKENELEKEIKASAKRISDAFNKLNDELKNDKRKRMVKYFGIGAAIGLAVVGGYVVYKKFTNSSTEVVELI